MSANCPFSISSISNAVGRRPRPPGSASFSHWRGGESRAGGSSLRHCAENDPSPRVIRVGWRKISIRHPVERNLAIAPHFFGSALIVTRQPRGRSARALAAGGAPSVPPDPLVGTGTTAPEGSGAAACTRGRGGGCGLNDALVSCPEDSTPHAEGPLFWEPS